MTPRGLRQGYFRWRRRRGRCDEEEEVGGGEGDRGVDGGPPPHLPPTGGRQVAVALLSAFRHHHGSRIVDLGFSEFLVYRHLSSVVGDTASPGMRGDLLRGQSPGTFSWRPIRGSLRSGPNANKSRIRSPGPERVLPADPPLRRQPVHSTTKRCPACGEHGALECSGAERHVWIVRPAVAQKDGASQLLRRRLAACRRRL